MVNHVFVLEEKFGRISDGYVVRPEGGALWEDDDDGNRYSSAPEIALEQETYWGDRELWIGWTSYPAPYWNEWHCLREVEDELYGPFQVWWYGEWI